MARINIEDDIKDDDRFIRLTALLGHDTAIGALVRLWMVGQKYWKKDKSLIPHDTWKKQNLNSALLTVGLAEDLPDGYYVAGAKDHFAWLFERVEGGRKGGSKTSDAKRAAAKNREDKKRENIEQNDHKLPQAHTSTHELPQASFSPSPSFSLSGSSSDSSSKKEGKVAPIKNLIAADFPLELGLISDVLIYRNVKPELAISWLSAFPDSSWIVSEVRKALAWETANPKRFKRNFGAFMTNWMNKGWDQRRHAGQGFNKAEAIGEQNAQMQARIERGEV